MKWFALILLTFMGLSCGGMLPGKSPKKTVKTRVETIDSHAADHLVYLSVLEAKYTREDRPFNLAIVRGMILELEGKNPSLTLPDSLPDLKEARKIPTFMSLEMTVEHLSHRESVKRNSGHSAYLHP